VVTPQLQVDQCCFSEAVVLGRSVWGNALPCLVYCM